MEKGFNQARGGAPDGGEYDASVVVPVLSHGESVGIVLAKLRGLVRDLGGRLEIVLVDDGCREPVATIAARWRTQFAALSVARHGEPRGIGAAARTGALVARGALVVVADPAQDLPLANVAVALEGLERGADVVLVSRHAEHGAQADSRSFLERAASTTVLKLSQLVLPVGVRDVFTPIHGLRSRAAKKIAQRAQVRGAAYGAEWTALAQYLGFEVAEYAALAFRAPLPRAPSIGVLRELWGTRRRFKGTQYEAPAHPSELLHETSFVKLDRAALMRGVSERSRR
jgi:glycosyltransferase involved in cell wall biosynthesis